MNGSPGSTAGTTVPTTSQAAASVLEALLAALNLAPDTSVAEHIIAFAETLARAGTQPDDIRLLFPDESATGGSTPIAGIRPVELRSWAGIRLTATGIEALVFVIGGTPHDGYWTWREPDPSAIRRECEPLTGAQLEQGSPEEHFAMAVMRAARPQY